MQESKKFAFDVGITFFASVITMLLGFVITVALGRYLGAGDLGLYRMTSTIYAITILIAATGIPSAMIKYVAEFKGNRYELNKFVSSGIITSLFLGIGFTVLFYFSSGVFAKIFNMPGLSDLLKILSLVFPFALINSVFLGLLNGLRKMKKYGIATIVQSVLMIVVTVPLIYYGFGVSGAIIGIVVSSLGGCLFLIWISNGYFEFVFNDYISTTKKILRFGIQLLGANMINMINYRADILLIGYFLTATDVGYYAVAVGLSRFLWIIPQANQRVVYPSVSEYWAKNNHAALQKMIDKSMKYTTCILLPIGLGTGFFAKDIVTLIFGEGFIHSVLPLLILLVGTVLNGSISQAIGGSLAGVGRPDLGLKVVSISASTNIILNILLIPYLGIAGAAIATTISLSVHTLLGISFTIKALKVKIDFEWFVKIFGVMLLSIFLFVWLGYINRYLIGAIILCVYIIIILVFLLTKEDRTYFIELIHEARSLLKPFV